MKEIFAELYTKVITFFKPEVGDNSKETATNRLKLVLMHDRTKLDPLTLEKMRSELVDVISKYVIIDKELLELNLEGEGDSIALMLNIPVVRAKTEEELALEAEETVETENIKEETEETLEKEPEEDEDILEVALDSEDETIEGEIAENSENIYAETEEKAEAEAETPTDNEVPNEDDDTDELDSALDSEEANLDDYDEIIVEGNKVAPKHKKK